MHGGCAVRHATEFGSLELDFPRVNVVSIPDRKTSAGSLEQLRRQGTGGSLCRRGSLERRAMSYSSATANTDDLAHSLATFKPITITVTNFFKQVNICTLLFRYLVAECPTLPRLFSAFIPPTPNPTPIPQHWYVT